MCWSLTTKFPNYGASLDLILTLFSIFIEFHPFSFPDFESWKKRSKVKTLNLPPGPWKLPIIGSIHHMILVFYPHHRLRELALKHGPLMHLKLVEVSANVVSSLEVAKEVMKTYDAIFTQRPHQVGADIMCYGSTDIATAPLGGYWKQLRRTCSQEVISNKRVRSYQSIREEVLNLMRYVGANTGSWVNLSEKVSCMTSAITARATFGEKCKHQEDFISLVKKLVKLVERLFVFDLFPSHKWLHVISGEVSKLEELHREYDMIIGNIIRKAEKKTGEVEVDSLLSVILNIKNHGALEYPLTIDNIKAVMLNMFGAGTATSSAVIDWAMSEMLKNPRVMTKAQDEVRRVFGSKGYTKETALQDLKFLKAIIKETLRLHPPFPLLLLPRQCRETCEVKGYTIPAGTKVIVNAWAIARDPKYWSEAEKFYTKRFMDSPIDYKGYNHELIPFGAGRRICPGISFGVSSVELCLAQLLYYFNWELPNGNKENDLEMTEALGASSRRKTGLVLVPISYNPVRVSHI